MDKLGPGFLAHYEWFEIFENHTYGDVMNILKPPEQFIKEVSFGEPSENPL